MKRNGAQILLVMAGTIAALLSIELLGRWAPTLFSFQPRVYAHQPDPDMGYTCTWQEDADSMRDVPIIALGDSFTGGTKEIPLSQMYPALLGQALNLRVLNLGCAGYGTPQELAMAKRWISRLKPRWVILEFFPGNDFVDSFDFTHWRAEHTDAPYELYLKIVNDNMSCDGLWFKLHVWLAGRSVVHAILYRFVRGMKNKMHPRFWVSRDTPRATDIGQGISLVSLRGVQSLATAAGARFLVVLAADGRAIDTSSAQPNYTATKDFMARNGMRFIDPGRELVRAKKAGLNVFLPDGHWSPTGQKIVAALIRKVI